MNLHCPLKANYPIQLCAVGTLLLMLVLFGCKEDIPEGELAIPEKVDFNFHIKPILVQKCYLCHGPDPSSREAGLRLDIWEGAIAPLENGQAAIVPGKPGKSRMIQRITHKDPSERMPPPESNLELSQREVELLKRWVKEGAVYKSHWAFTAIENPIRDEKSLIPGNEVDYFVQNKLIERGIQPVKMADKTTLIRRVAYLITGLPPKPEQVLDYLSDNSPGAYEKMLDYYLGSPAYGERWARHWMDVVRYAETKGHEFDFSINGAWRYRDYLIRAFNQDVPFDQLVREQIAGDLIENPRFDPYSGINESRLGTVFYTLGEGTHSPVDVKKDETDRIDNMIDVTTKSFQALTVSCAKCHDHKFDPIPTTDYYSLYGMMESTRFSPLPANNGFKDEINLEEAEKIQAFIYETVAKDWSNSLGEDLPVTLTGRRENSANAVNSGVQVLGDFRSKNLNGWRSDGKAFGQYSTLGRPVWEQQQIKRLEDGKASSRMIKTGIFGALRSPDFIIEKDFIGLNALGNGGSIRIVMDNFQLISYPIYGGMDQKVNSESWKRYIFEVSAWKGQKAYVEILPGAYYGHVYRQKEKDYIEVQYAIAYDSEWEEPPTNDQEEGFSAQGAIDNWMNNKSTSGEIITLNRLLESNRIRNHFPESLVPLKKINELVGAVVDTLFFNGVSDGFGLESPVFIRGNHKEPSKEKVPRAFLSAVPVKKREFNPSGSGRMEFAESILDPDNTLTSRVMVNRIWHHLFGKGIVETVDNFGLQGKLPSHPELLDFLAARFQEEGWSIKKIIRLIALSETFRRSTLSNEALNQRDPENIGLGRYPVRRLEAEAIRDALLLSSGNLDSTLYGPSVPVHLTGFMQGRGRPQRSGPLDGNGRRSIYLEVRRNFLDPMMMTFDRPTPFSTFGNRDVTNVPSQSLLMMNDPFVVQQAEKMARRLLEEQSTGLEDRIRKIYLISFSRKPDADELKEASRFILELAAAYQAPKESIMENHEIWTAYCHTIFNLKEFIYLI